MELQDLLNYLKILWRELLRLRFAAVLGFIVITSLVVLIGYSWPTKFSSSTTIYADHQNIIRPLLDKSAAVSKVEDQTRVVRDVIYSPRILQQAIRATWPKTENLSPAEVERIVERVRSNLIVKGLGSSYIKITYSDMSAHDTYQLLSKLTEIFIRDSSSSQQQKSQEAYTFIDAQVSQYKQQLIDAENKLKEFNTSNFDGRDQDVDGRISDLRQDIETLKLSIDEDKSRIEVIKRQLSEESEFSAKARKADLYKELISDLQAELDMRMLTLKEDHPDVVDLKLQLQDMTDAMMAAESEKENHESKGSDNSGMAVNPFFAEQKLKLADAEVGLQTKQKRLKATEKLLKQEFERRKRIAERQAELAELTRDYNVTRDIYEDMLASKEKARLSMTLSAEGQGITFRIQEPADYPLSPSGLRFLYFYIAAPLVGFSFVIGALFVYIMVDPRVRMSSMFDGMGGISVLAEVPHLHRPINHWWQNRDILLLFLLVGGFTAFYIGIAISKLAGNA
ncbi:XrtA system polysaccharide chain length determinant [Teredinibacter sp. KSP-S5-2]|uniref:XrtA system polysaccharide chain length determinant n=1 Tax=Teredinibacter sp. KSP-S5-2 TaxID=3034506 RepID=UPI002934DD04|nr:XrtA system polysaccharide chain length determinant [Teredinibacter sp. KSP-S5-2]WNO09037.1 hypothetical protein P5V12_19010 [Teredinibacter sp. KSP-S5-2]